MEKFTEDLLRKYKLQKIEEQIKSLNFDISQSNDDNKVIELMKEVKELQQEKKVLLTAN